MFVLVSGIVYLGMLIRDVEIPVILPVKHVQVSGELNFLDREDLRSLVAANITGGYFTVNLNQVREILLQQPWIKTASLRRTWPASVDVSVVERVPVAYWNDDAYLSQAGQVFKPKTISTGLNLPHLSGTTGQHEKVWKFMNVLYKETALLNYEVVKLELDERRAWQMVIANPQAASEHIRVRLGRFDTQKRMQRFVHILPALMAANTSKQSGRMINDIRLIDMRYPNGFAVQMDAVHKNNQSLQPVPDRRQAMRVLQQYRLEA